MKITSHQDGKLLQSRNVLSAEIERLERASGKAAASSLGRTYYPTCCAGREKPFLVSD
jgi:hypothetical protein